VAIITRHCGREATETSGAKDRRSLLARLGRSLLEHSSDEFEVSPLAARCLGGTCGGALDGAEHVRDLAVETDAASPASLFEHALEFRGHSTSAGARRLRRTRDSAATGLEHGRHGAGRLRHLGIDGWRRIGGGGAQKIRLNQEEELQLPLRQPAGATHERLDVGVMLAAGGHGRVRAGGGQMRAG
jgi:hypothetical protein